MRRAVVAASQFATVLAIAVVALAPPAHANWRHHGGGRVVVFGGVGFGAPFYRPYPYYRPYAYPYYYPAPAYYAPPPAYYPPPPAYYAPPPAYYPPPQPGYAPPEGYPPPPDDEQ